MTEARFLGTRPSEGRAFEAEATASAEALRRGTLRVWEEPLGGQESRERWRGEERVRSRHNVEAASHRRSVAVVRMPPLMWYETGSLESSENGSGSN